MRPPYQLPGELTIYSAMETRDSLLAWVDRYADKPESEWPALFYTVLNSRIMDWKRKQARRSKWRVWMR